MRRLLGCLRVGRARNDRARNDRARNGWARNGWARNGWDLATSSAPAVSSLACGLVAAVVSTVSFGSDGWAPISQPSSVRTAAQPTSRNAVLPNPMVSRRQDHRGVVQQPSPASTLGKQRHNVRSLGRHASGGEALGRHESSARPRAESETSRVHDRRSDYERRIAYGEAPEPSLVTQPVESRGLASDRIDDRFEAFDAMPQMPEASFGRRQTARVNTSPPTSPNRVPMPMANPLFGTSADANTNAGRTATPRVAARPVTPGSLSPLRPLPPVGRPASVRPLDWPRPNFDPRSQSTASADSGARLGSRASIGRPAASVAPRTLWLQSSTPIKHRKLAAELLRQARHEYRVRAWASAEASAWRAIRITAEGIDIAASSASAPVAGVGDSRSAAGPDTSTATGTLSIARTALREAVDFSSPAASRDPGLLAKMIRSHQTKVLHASDLDRIGRTEAIDRYMNEARIQLSKIASVAVDAAEAMDLIAAIHLARSEHDTASKNTLADATALSLRRAAFKGQPSNASLATQLGRHLAEVGLYSEAEWALRQAWSVSGDPAAASALAGVLRSTGDHEAASRMIAAASRSQPGTRRLGATAGVVRVSPQQFAALSRGMPVSRLPQRMATPAGRQAFVPPETQSPVAVVNRVSDVPQTNPAPRQATAAVRPVSGDVRPFAPPPEDAAPRSAVGRVVDSLRRIW